jgi:RNA polymerase sigma-70 factor (ECF subfamily)
VGPDREGAFEDFWRRHYVTVARAASAITGNVEDGAEVAQEAFARAYQRWSRVSSLDRPDAWVQRVAVNLSISTLRRHARAAAIPTTDQAVPAPTEPDDDLLLALRALSPHQRAVVVLRYYLDMSVDDVARVLGKRPGTVRALTHQAMSRLRTLLVKEPHDG